MAVNAVIVFFFTEMRALAATAYQRKLRVLFYFGSEALIVGKMEMEIIEFEHCRRIDYFFYFLHGKEMTTDVHHKAAIRKYGLIPYFTFGEHIPVLSQNLLIRNIGIV